ncbi:hypothetical protein AAGQ41_26750, partial [Klebsiella pneumoniae]
MTKIKLLALGVLIATSASAAHADGKFTLGAGVGVVEHPYKQYDADVYPVPVIREGANKQVISSQADSLIKISRIWA